MMLCHYNPILLKHEWAVELVQYLGGKVIKGRFTALMSLFAGNIDNADFNSIGFKLLWEKEKGIKMNELKKRM